jgi:hypothetical protein
MITTKPTKTASVVPTGSTLVNQHLQRQCRAPTKTTTTTKASTTEDENVKVKLQARRSTTRSSNLSSVLGSYDDIAVQCRYVMVLPTNHHISQQVVMPTTPHCPVGQRWHHGPVTNEYNQKRSSV